MAYPASRYGRPDDGPSEKTKHRYVVAGLVATIIGAAIGLAAWLLPVTTAQDSGTSNPVGSADPAIDPCLVGLWRYEGPGSEFSGTDGQDSADSKTDLALRFSREGIGTLEAVSRTTLNVNGRTAEMTMDGTRSFVADTDAGVITFSEQNGSFSLVSSMDGVETERKTVDITLHSGTYTCGGNRLTMALLGERTFTLIRAS
ncbi:hypothetical protein [Planotetraspora mira]|uniref:Uncharacterized protein n=1 Tax=Planotetraspora mira TaxID=58121 RepID=A0A8J3TZS9_9ACTN|nr:hypothetical protein [Planotetraspora mira]GII30165.1 hypothetical protein Pmi06nite_36070 [Planotetraspora mira]